jgi:hypothetical protein
MSETKDNDQDSGPIVLSPAALQAAKTIQSLAGLGSIEEAISRALGDEAFFQQKIKEGWSVVLKRDNKFWELDW